MERIRINTIEDKSLYEKTLIIYELLRRTLDDLNEAYYRTPPFISSKIYILRSINRVKAGINLCRELLNVTKNV